MGCQTKDFFAALEQIICSGSTATLSAITACNHFAGISIKAGKIHALRYRNQTGNDALTAFQTLEVRSFSWKNDLSNLCYTPIPTDLSNQKLSLALGDRITINRPNDKGNHLDASRLDALPEPTGEPTSKKEQLFYRGQPVVSQEASAPEVVPASELKYRGQSLTGSKPSSHTDSNQSSPERPTLGVAPQLEYRGSHSNPFIRTGKSSS